MTDYKILLLVLVAVLYFKKHWVYLLFQSIGLLAAVVSGFSIYSWIFLVKKNQQENLEFILRQSKTWTEYGNKRNAETRVKAPILIQRLKSTKSADPLVFSKYQKVVGEIILNVCKDFIQGNYSRGACLGLGFWCSAV